MSQAWYIGPIAAAGTGDVGVVTGFAVAWILYMGLRAIELSVLPARGRLLLETSDPAISMPEL